MNETQIHRKLRLYQVCAKRGLRGTPLSLQRHQLQQVIVDEKNKLLYCWVPKVGRVNSWCKKTKPDARPINSRFSMGRGSNAMWVGFSSNVDCNAHKSILCLIGMEWRTDWRKKLPTHPLIESPNMSHDIYSRACHDMIDLHATLFFEALLASQQHHIQAST